MADLRSRGLKDAAIGRQMGLSKSYFHQIKNSATPSDHIIELMCKTFGFKFTTENESSGTGKDAPGHAEAAGTTSEFHVKLRDLYQSHERILAKVERFMDRYEAVVVERDALKAERDQLRAQLAQAAQN